MSHLQRLFSLVFLFVCTSILGQDKSENLYQPSSLTEFESYLEHIYEVQNAKLKNQSRYHKKLRKLYEEQQDEVWEEVQDSSYVFVPAIQSKLTSILNTIYQSNSDIDAKDYRFLVSRSLVPNARSYGNGLFAINLGLLRVLESEDELAFILCHEIAHTLLDHSIEGMTEYYETWNSKETKKKIRQSRKGTEGKRRALLGIYDEISVSQLQQSREKESEADSLGFQLYAQTPYRTAEGISALKKLRHYEDMVWNQPVKLDSTFHFKNYPFKATWLKKPSSLFETTVNNDDFSLKSDTISSHPDILFRIDRIKNLYKEVLEIGSSREAIALGTIKSLSENLMLKSVFDFQSYDYSMYLLIEMHRKQNISDALYYTKMTQLLEAMYKAMKSHRLGHYVQTQNSQSNEKELNSIRLFVNNLELGELKRIGWAFCQKYQEQAAAHPDFQASYEFFKSINN